MQKLFKRLNIKPKDKKLYERAFTHTSYAYEKHLTESYERLEFLGDAALDLIISDYLFNNKHYEEGEMTRIRASYVCENALYEYANDLHLSDYIKVGHGEQNNGGTHKKTIMSDVFEALIAAIYLDLGYKKTKEVVLNIIVPYLEDKNIHFFSDYKSALQESVQTTKKSVTYNLIKEEGPSHNRTFTTEVLVDGIVLGKGEGHSKKEAEQIAAKEALNLLAKK